MTALSYLPPYESHFGTHHKTVKLESIECVRAYLVHETKLGNQRQAFLTQHTVTDNKIGSPASCSIQAIIHELSQLDKTKNKQDIGNRELLDERILFQNGQEVLFHFPEAIYPMRFKENNKHGFVVMNVPMPAHLFYYRYTSKSLWTFALDSNDRPTLHTPLYLSPIPNIYSSNKLCVGSNKMPSKTDTNVLDTLIDICMCSVSTSSHIKEPLKGVFGSNINKYLRSTKNDTQFDKSKLIPCSITIEALWRMQ